MEKEQLPISLPHPNVPVLDTHTLKEKKKNPNRSCYAYNYAMCFFTYCSKYLFILIEYCFGFKKV
jgi:hypothetical protein